jgi:hypothetical protein
MGRLPAGWALMLNPFPGIIFRVRVTVVILSIPITFLPSQQPLEKSLAAATSFIVDTIPKPKQSPSDEKRSH